ncbi:TPA: hypothetical protein L9G83_005598 [Klebsiella pneumoniae]|uniref:hypothetical protein n=1 Tax=Klebsiella pneumoniae complex TaxID=3390273 RepID=UPI000D5A2177|nr:MULTISPECIES: hypothetical protein [Klebsiella]HCI5780494.1 hypothetical protein [Klebsiella quasipneumoniae subsp. quasipneumoniae]HDU3840492.1 hypothetical protein [Klebsiella pneumoniae subsp. pneumoniae]EKD8976344.1 hypothetical protein [Klebsiella pneumoniae]MBJ3773728.1 hypothetical protein [Klebsiella pneumoniae]MBP3989248.1 hypothetical protein [Klebsiella pneumoniae]
MRLTVLDEDPGERIEPGRERITVYLDGIEVKYSFSADSDKGEVIAAVLDSRGYPTAKNGEVKRETLFGHVRIERCPR